MMKNGFAIKCMCVCAMYDGKLIELKNNEKKNRTLCQNTLK